MDLFEAKQLEVRKTLTSQKIRDDLFSFIRTLERELAKINRDTLNKKSQDIDGQPIGFYSQATEFITGGRKAKGQPFDLKESGDFLKSIYAKVEEESIFFDASDPKVGLILQNTLSDDLFGLQDQDLNKVIDEKILPFFITYLAERL
jgi:hypothetical protein